MENNNNIFGESAIDRAIVMTQYDLRGFAHPLGFRSEYMSSAKAFNATVHNFFAFIHTPNKSVFDYYKASYEEFLLECKKIFSSCDESSKEAIQLIIKEMIKQHKEFESQIQEGKREKSNYLLPLNKDNAQGRAILSLAEVFDVKVV